MDLDCWPVKPPAHVGRLKKKFEETALLGQKWLKDEEKTVQEVLKDRHMRVADFQPMIWTAASPLRIFADVFSYC